MSENRGPPVHVYKQQSYNFMIVTGIPDIRDFDIRLMQELDNYRVWLSAASKATSPNEPLLKDEAVSQQQFQHLTQSVTTPYN